MHFCFEVNSCLHVCDWCSVLCGLTVITLKRVYSTLGDTDCDSVFNITRLGQIFIIWALGPRGSTAFQHFERSGGEQTHALTAC